MSHGRWTWSILGRLRVSRPRGGPPFAPDEMSQRCERWRTGNLCRRTIINRPGGKYSRNHAASLTAASVLSGRGRRFGDDSGRWRRSNVDREKNCCHLVHEPRCCTDIGSEGSDLWACDRKTARVVCGGVGRSCPTSPAHGRAGDGRWAQKPPGSAADRIDYAHSERPCLPVCQQRFAPGAPRRLRLTGWRKRRRRST